MHTSFSSKVKLGILGGGQLGRMFIQEAINYNIGVHILDPDPNAPCNTIAESFTVGNFNDYQTVLDFGRPLDIISIEIEHVNVDALEELEKEGKKVYPSPALLSMVQDKGLQKLFYQKHKIPTAPFHLVEKKTDISLFSSSFPFMQKLRKGGYDGRGVCKLDNPKKLDKAFDAPSVLENLIDFDKEISVIVARNESGEIKFFPIVELEFNPEANLVEYLFAPARIGNTIEQKAFDIAEMVAKATDLIGILAVEMFVTKDGDVLVNEIAPRPHNSGHHTIEANITSQYEQHLRSILNLPLGSTKAVSAAVMLNLLGEKGYEGEALYEGFDEALRMEGVKVHLYGKKITKPFRKMGHVTIVDINVESAMEKARELKQILKVKA